MDLEKHVTLREIAASIRRSYNSLRNEVVQAPSDPSRGTLHLRFVSIPLFRVGRTWLARQSDVQALLSPVPSPDFKSAPQVEVDQPAPRRRPGRPRKSIASIASIGVR